MTEGITRTTLEVSIEEAELTGDKERVERLSQRLSSLSQPNEGITVLANFINICATD